MIPGPAGPDVLSLQSLSLKSGTFMRVDRGSEWGNPFIMKNKTDHERNLVCDLYEQYAIWRLTIDPQLLVPLRGKNLACWCAPRRCHGDTLLRLANKETL